MMQGAIAVILLVFVVIIRRGEGLGGLGRGFANGKPLRVSLLRRPPAPDKAREKSTSSHGHHTSCQKHYLAPVYGIIVVEGVDVVCDRGPVCLLGRDARRVAVAQRRRDA